ncbi:hypothetical protein PEPS_11670 [Persicobacter psychrovividus]|uniref:ComEC/Rec2-related protein domain-containing protein n=1 Tax=Persicobacter psychrovividus TaxID=387638 RepID=A0ABM7VD61_9BACT|nr:hypothetical protein PEPS_11670 [Persicobacter psychrovividus]
MRTTQISVLLFSLILGIIGSKTIDLIHSIAFLLILVIFLTSWLFLKKATKWPKILLCVSVSLLIPFTQQSDAKISAEQQLILKGHFFKFKGKTGYFKSTETFKKQWIPKNEVCFLEITQQKPPLNSSVEILLEHKKHNNYSYIAYTSSPTTNIKNERIKNLLNDLLGKNITPKAIGLLAPLCWAGHNQHTDTIKNRYRQTGIAHTLAVSGMHVGIVLGFCFFLLQINPKKRYLPWPKALLIMIFLFSFCYIVGDRASVYRAVGMTMIFLFAKISGRQFNLLNALLWTCYLLLIFSPNLLFDLGFQLSSLAVLGIGWLFPPLFRHFKGRITKVLVSIPLVGCCAQVFTLPLILFYFKEVSNWGFLTNYLVSISIPFFFVAGWLMIVISPLSVIAKPLGQWLSYIIEQHERFLEYLAQQPFAMHRIQYFDEMMVLGFWLIALSLIGFWGYRKKWCNWGIALGLVLCLSPYLKHKWNQPLTADSIDIHQIEDDL